MKKRVTFFMALAAGAMIMLSSCSKSTDALIDEYAKVSAQLSEAAQTGDINKITSLTEKAMKISAQIDERELTPEQQERMTNIILESLDY